MTTRTKPTSRAVSNVVQISDYNEPPQKPLYEKHALPFFDRERLSNWAVQPTGNYWDDCDTGRAYAISFLKSCDGTNGWCALMPNIVADMIRAGPDGKFADGHLKVDGIVIGFMSTIGRAVARGVAEKSA